MDDHVYTIDLINKLAADLSNKCDWAYLEMFWYGRARLSLNLVQTFNLLVPGLRRGRHKPFRKIPVDRVEAYRIVIRGTKKFGILHWLEGRLNVVG